MGGDTKFMTVHRINLAHAQDVGAQLLEAVIDAAAPKLEGDAAFFFTQRPRTLPAIEGRLPEPSSPE